MTQSVEKTVAQWADRKNFGPSILFGDVRTTALPPHGPRVSGFYLLEFDNGTYYLGESVDLRSRMAGHKAKWGDEITSVRLFEVAASKQELKRTERALTHDLGAAEVPLRNVLNASITTGVDALGELLSDDEQNQWQSSPVDYNSRDMTPLKNISAQAVRYSTAARRYAEHPRHDDVTAVLRKYLEGCVPAPRATEYQYWSVSTGTYAGSPHPRRFCVSVGKMEVCVVNAHKADDAALAGFVVVRASILDGEFSKSTFDSKHGSITRRESKYEDAGGDATVLHADSLEALDNLLSDPAVQMAAGALVLDVMRKHFCVYTRYHCPQLVEMVYPDFERAGQQSDRGGALLVDNAVAPDSQDTDEELPDSSTVEEIEDLGDVEIFWIVGAGSQKSKRNQPTDFESRSEWRMDPDSKYERKVADMRPGERIAVRSRRNISQDVPFDNRGLPVSVMDFYLRGVITHNPGDGCSVAVEWEKPPTTPLRFYLYTSQDTVWPLVAGWNSWADQLIEFVFQNKPQDVDATRNAPFWAERFGDR
ncbi:MAG: GIY-YIG nuclease family protein [Rhodococcus sp. (in: high G+C Gram-positive bacteria)]